MNNTITIGFSKPKKWKPFAWLIMMGYNIPYDHVYVKVHFAKYEVSAIYQASQIAVNFMSMDVFSSANYVVKEFTMEISSDSYKKFMQFAISSSGKPYGVKEVLGLMIVRIAELCGKTISNPFNDSGATYVCSELVATILEDFADIKLPKPANEMSPKDIYDFLSSTKG